MNLKELLQHELIGLEISVIESKNKCNIGIAGKIIDETKETLVIQKNSKKKRLFKKNIRFEAAIGGKSIIIDGKKFKSYKRAKK